MTKLFFDIRNKGMFGSLQAQVSDEIVKALKSGESFYVEIDKLKQDKTYQQLRGFYEALNQLRPQYNERRKGEEKSNFLEYEMEYVLKKVGGWYSEIIDKQGNKHTVVKSFKNITKKELQAVLKKIKAWAVQEGYSLEITKDDNIC